MRNKKQGFTIIELLVIIGVVAIVGTVLGVSLPSRKRTTELSTATQRMAALLREAQSRSMSQASSSSWGVHFENSSAPFFALFSGTYSTSSRESYYALPLTVAYQTSSIAASKFAEIIFSQISGIPSGSSSIGIYLLASSSNSSTLTISSSGAVSY